MYAVIDIGSNTIRLKTYEYNVIIKKLISAKNRRNWYE